MVRAARAGPVGAPVRPAALRAVGKITEKPAPAQAKPASATRGWACGQGDAQSYGREGPAGADQGGGAQAFREPVPEEASEGHRKRERRVAGGGESWAGFQGIVKVDGAPVSHRAFPEEDAERDDPKPQQRPRRAGERRRSLIGGVGVRGQERAVGDDEGDRGEDGHRREMGQGADPLGAEESAERGSARPPKLQAAWKEDMIGRPYPLSTATACAFIATSSPPFAAPSMTRAGTRGAGSGPAPA